MIGTPQLFDRFCCVFCGLSLAPIAIVAIHEREKLIVMKFKQIWNDNDVSRTTFIFALATLGLGLMWLCLEIMDLPCKKYMEPATTLAGLFTGLFAFVVDPHIEKENERKRIIAVVEDECETNKTSLEENSKYDPNVTAGGVAYRRLWTFAIEEALSSGLFSGQVELVKIMKCCRINFGLLNATLLIVESRMKNEDKDGNLFIHRGNLLDSQCLHSSKESNNYLIRELEAFHKESKPDADEEDFEC